MAEASKQEAGRFLAKDSWVHLYLMGLKDSALQMLLLSHPYLVELAQKKSFPLLEDPIPWVKAFVFDHRCWGH